MTDVFLIESGGFSGLMLGKRVKKVLGCPRKLVKG